MWLEFIKRDVPNWDKKPHIPRNPNSWYKVYRKLHAESMKEVDEDAVLLKAQMDRIKQEQAKKTIKAVELNVYKVPEHLKRQGPTLVMTRKPQFQDKVYRPPPELRIKDSDSDPDEPSHPVPGYSGQLARQRHSARPSNSTSRAVPAQKSKLDKFRKEVKAMGHFQHHNQNKGQDSKLKPVSANKIIKAAPRRLVEEHRKPAPHLPLDPSSKASTIFMPRRTRIEPERLAAEKQESRKLSSAARSTLLSDRSKPLAISTPPNADEPIPSIELPATSPLLRSAAREAIPPLNKIPIQDPSTQVQAQPKPRTSTPNIGSVRPPFRNSAVVRAGASTSSPPGSGTRPPMQIKRKPPVDIFMRPTKRQRAE